MGAIRACDKGTTLSARHVCASKGVTLPIGDVEAPPTAHALPQVRLAPHGVIGEHDNALEHPVQNGRTEAVGSCSARKFAKARAGPPKSSDKRVCARRDIPSGAADGCMITD